MVLAEFAAIPPHLADGEIDLAHVVIGIGEDEAGPGGIAGGVLRPFAHQGVLRLFTLLEDAEHPAAVDAGELPVVADQDQFGAGALGVAGQLRHQLRPRPWRPRPP
jgi:hypothetical protein